MTKALRVVHEMGSAVSVSDGSTELFHYVYDADDPQVESPRPYFHPLRSRAGDVVSVYRPWDHVWHKGLALSLPHFGGQNFWGGPTFVREQDYQWLDNNGAMRHHGEVAFQNRDEQVSFTHSLRWTTQAGAHLVSERRTVHTRLLDESTWALVLDTVLTNRSGHAVVIGSPTTEGRENAGYGGLFWRGPRSFAGADVRTESAVGEDQVMGSRGAWAALTGRHDETDRWSSVVIVDDAENLRHPVKWFARTSAFATLCPAPFFDEEYEFAADADLRLRYAFIVADGRADAAALARHAHQGVEFLDRTRQGRPVESAR